MDDLLLQVGVGGIFAVLLIDRVLKFVKDWRAQEVAAKLNPLHSGPHETLGSRKVDEIHRVLDARDEDGVPKVYTPRRHSLLLEELIVLTRESENTQTELLAAVNMNTSAVKHLRDAVNSLAKIDTGTASGVHLAADRKA